MARSIDRRTFLRGALGTALALPLLDIMLDDNGTALANGSALPCRYLLTFGAFSLVTDDDPGPDGFVPNTLGAGYDLKPGLVALGAHDVRDEVSVLSGLEVPIVPVGSVPPPGGLNFFHRKSPAWFCGETVHMPSTDKAPLQASYPSSDQLAADVLHQGQTPFRSLHYRVQVKHYYTGEAWPDEGQMSWQDDGNGNVIGVEPHFSPQAAFQALFTQFTPTDPTEAQAKAFELAKRGSILDLIDRRGGNLMKIVGASDRLKIEQHLSHVRDLELLVSSQGGPIDNSACQQLPDPGMDPSIGGDNTSNFQGWNIDEGYSDEHARAQTFTDLMHMALTCDLTRAATLQYSHVASQLNAHPITGIQQKMHSFHHGNGTIADLNKIIDWHIDHFARLIAKLKATPEGNGSLLDNCAIGFMNEGGRGATGGSHSGEDLAFLFAGGAGGLKRGEHVRVAGAAHHPANMLITLMQTVGVNTDQLGEMSGAIGEMLA